jgi:mono/diheme cytochrome c family protein
VVNVRRRFVSAAAVGALVVATGTLALFVIYQPAIPAIERPDLSSLPAILIERGAKLAAIGDCAVCHTAPNGQPFAGGRSLPTPFGTIFASNITPDPATGIGAWSSAAFRRAMKRGIARDGAYLYPAFPYDHFTHVDDADLDAIYAFLMTRPPARQAPPPNRLVFPLGFRPLLAGWDLFFLRTSAFIPAPNQSKAWNRGAYLVEGLGHCGACHTPRNLAGSEEPRRDYAGGEAEDWNAPPLDASNPSPIPWTVDSLTTYLRTGFESEHGAAAGPMGPVVDELSEVPLSDVRSIAIYVTWLMRRHGAPAMPVDRGVVAAREMPTGAALFAGACAGCHETGAPMLAMGGPSLGAASDLRQDTPRNTIETLLHGVQPPSSRAAWPYMPDFGNALTDSQIANISAYLRARFSNRHPWPDLETSAAIARREGSEP